MYRAVTIAVAFVSLLIAAVSPAPVQSQATEPSAAQLSACLVGRWDGDTGSYADIWGEGGYAYIAKWGSDENSARVHVIDISNPANPVLDETLFIPPPNNDASPQDVKVGDGLLFVALESDGDDGVAIYDVRFPASRQLVATVRVPGFEFVHNVFYDNGFLYIPRSTRIAIVDFTSFAPDNPPASPITSAKWLLTGVGTSFVHDITVRNGRLYVAAWDSGLRIYDVTNVATTMPTLLGSVGGNNTHSMWPTDDGKFVVTGEERFGGGIKVYRITDIGGSLTLTLTDSRVLPNASSVHNQVIVGNRLYNSWYEEGLQVFDINPITGQLELVASFDTANNWGVYPLLGPDRILLSDIAEGLFVVALGEACVCVVGSPPEPDVILAMEPVVSTKNRFLSFRAVDEGGPQAVRVTFLDLPPPFDVWNGHTLWVDAPRAVSENSGTIDPADSPAADTFNLARLRCDEPVFLNWNAPGVVHIFHEGIVPGGLYLVQMINATCSPESEASFSAPLELTQAKWGDTVKDCATIPCPPPDGVTNIIDVLALVDKFVNAPTAIIKARAELVNTDANIGGCVNLKTDIIEVLRAVDALLGLPYPFAPSVPDPCGSTCPNPFP